MNETALKQITKELLEAKPLAELKEQTKETYLKRLNQILNLLFLMYYELEHNHVALEVMQGPQLEKRTEDQEILTELCDQIESLNCLLIPVLMRQCKALTMTTPWTGARVFPEAMDLEMQKLLPPEEQEKEETDYNRAQEMIETGLPMYNPILWIAYLNEAEAKYIRQMAISMRKKRQGLNAELLGNLEETIIKHVQKNRFDPPHLVHPALKALRTSKEAFERYLIQQIPDESFTDLEFAQAIGSLQKPNPWALRRLQYLAKTQPYVLRIFLKEGTRRVSDSRRGLSEGDLRYVSRDPDGEQRMSAKEPTTGMESVLRNGAETSGGVYVSRSDTSTSLNKDILSGVPSDFVIKDNELGVGSEEVRFQNNINAIKTLKTFENEKRWPTQNEQETLAKCEGWGGFANAFDEKNLASRY